MTRGEMSAKTTYKRSSKGSILIPQCSPDGKYVVLQNNGSKVCFLFNICIVYYYIINESSLSLMKIYNEMLNVQYNFCEVFCRLSV